jgi:hypothetical protein
MYFAVERCLTIKLVLPELQEIKRRSWVLGKFTSLDDQIYEQ